VVTGVSAADGEPLTAPASGVGRPGMLALARPGCGRPQLARQGLPDAGHAWRVAAQAPARSTRRSAAPLAVLGHRCVPHPTRS